MKNQKRHQRNIKRNESASDKILKSSVLSLAITAAIGLTVLLLGAAIAYNTEDATALIEPIGYTAIFVTSFFGGFVSSKLCKTEPIAVSLVTGACFVLFSMLLSLALPHHLSSGMTLGYRAVLHLLSLALFPVGAVLGVKASHPKKRKRR